MLAGGGVQQTPFLSDFSNTASQPKYAVHTFLFNDPI